MKRVIKAAEEKPSASKYTTYTRSLDTMIKDANRKAGIGELDKAMFTLDRAADHLEIINNKIKSSGEEDFHELYIEYYNKIKHLEDLILREMDRDYGDA
jgi:hypothetical protein